MTEEHIIKYQQEGTEHSREIVITSLNESVILRSNAASDDLDDLISKACDILSFLRENDRRK